MADSSQRVVAPAGSPAGPPGNRPEKHDAAAAAIPLCVDLDGTLIRSDMLFETLALALKWQPWCIVLLPFWLLQGKSVLKRRLAERANFNPECLPYQSEVIEFLRAERASGRTLILTTASDLLVAEKIALHLAFFDAVIASEPGSNRKGGAKLVALQARFPQGFDYAGDCSADLPLWAAARKSILVDAGERLQQTAVSRGATLERAFTTPHKSIFWRLRKALRIHQWAKNLLIFVPVITSHRIADFRSVGRSALAFLAFSLCASCVYVINDLLDLEADRRHATKRKRPFAAGSLPLTAGFALVPMLLAGSAAILLTMPFLTVVVLTLYFALTLLYSFYLKRKLLLDVFALSGLYTIRIVMGHASTGIPFSAWLLSFSIFFFLSLAFIKRAAELQRLRAAGAASAHGRGYRATDLEQINVLGVASGYLSALVFALYINSDNVLPLYHNPQILWLMCPLVLYWISRVWIISFRGELNEDPILFAIKDRVTYLVVLVSAALLFVASRSWPALAELGLK
jgi:4-hydroxybenzoate polyprenyltransferase/phosphoserine phosphatase